MADFIKKHRASVTALIILAGILAMFIDVKMLEQQHPIFQWCIMIIGGLLVIYVQFKGTVDVIEYEEERYMGNFDENGDFDPTLPGPSPEEMKNRKSYAEIVNQHNNSNNDLEEIKDSKFKRTVFIMQPITVTENEFEQTINNQPTMKKTSALELKAAQPKKEGIKSYSLNNVPKRFRAMYGDVCNFAISGEPKTTEELIKKVQLFGHPFEELNDGNGLMAFDLGLVRVPLEGFFETK